MNMKNICISSTFLCLCPVNLSFKLTCNISKKAYISITPSTVRFGVLVGNTESERALQKALWKMHPVRCSCILSLGKLDIPAMIIIILSFCAGFGFWLAGPFSSTLRKTM